MKLSVLTLFTVVDDHRPAVEGSTRSPGTYRLRSPCIGWSIARSPSWGLERRLKMAVWPTADLVEWVAGAGRGELDRPTGLAADEEMVSLNSKWTSFSIYRYQCFFLQSINWHIH